MKRIPALLLSLTLAVCGCTERQSPAKSDLLNLEAGLHDGLPYPVLTWKPITVVVDRKQGATSTLFGNDVAVTAARGGQSYPAGAVLGLVTWQERDDPHWFGAKIPGVPVQVEFVEVSADGMKCRAFAGSPITEQTSSPCSGSEIASMKAIALP